MYRTSKCGDKCGQELPRAGPRRGGMSPAIQRPLRQDQRRPQRSRGGTCRRNHPVRLRRYLGPRVLILNDLGVFHSSWRRSPLPRTGEPVGRLAFGPRTMAPLLVP